MQGISVSRCFSLAFLLLQPSFFSADLGALLPSQIMRSEMVRIEHENISNDERIKVGVARFFLLLFLLSCR